MNITFKSIKIENFMSFGHSELELSRKGYVLVTGVNKNPKDSAQSNGSGKTTIFNAISWALTGQTLNGIKSNVSNINIPDGCYVELEFTCDNKEYRLIRSKDHSVYKTDLKIYIDDKDCSGKGIRDSEKLLEQYIPDLSAQLLGSVILLGQGLPQRFTNNTPSGRKEVLEKLSKSDFMIEDLKTKLSKRKTTLYEEIRKYDDEILVANTTINCLSKSIIDTSTALSKMPGVESTQMELQELNKRIETIQIVVGNGNASVVRIQEELRTLNNTILQRIQESNDQTRVEDSKYFELKNQLTQKELELKSRLNSLTLEVQRLKNIKDVCPTCGQKIPGVLKPDTTSQEAEISQLNVELSNILKQKQELDQNHTSSITKIMDEMKLVVDPWELEKTRLTSESTRLSNNIATLNIELQTSLAKKAQYETSIQNYAIQKEKYKNDLKTYQDEKEKLESTILYKNNERDQLNLRLGYVNKMITIATRDFRGYLLTNIISYIDSVAKNYSSKIFNTTLIDFYLDGNNLDITYDKKLYEGLSTGEKQKVDLIIQLSLRDMLCKFMNFNCNILALDEVFDGLDSLGCERIVDLINGLSDIESIFIITHHQGDISISYDSEIVVVKNSEGISEIS